MGQKKKNTKRSFISKEVARDVSIPWKNIEGETVLSYNPVYTTIYIGNNAKEEDLVMFREFLKKKKYKVTSEFSAKKKN